MKNTLFLCLLLLGCSADQQQAQDHYDSGRRLSLQADSLLQAQQIKEGRHTYNQAIDQFEHALSQDNANLEAINALAFCHYQLDNYAEAAKQYEHALQLSPELPIAKLYLGFCFINQDQIETGRAYIDAAMALDQSLRPKAITELLRIGQTAFDYGQGSGNEGVAKEEYQRFAIGVLLVAWEYSPENPLIQKRLLNYGEKIGDQRIIDYFK